MTASRWKKVRTILDGIRRRKSEAERRAYLKQACGDSASLRADVEALLHHLERDGGRLAAFSSLTGKRLLHYQLLEKVGEGTMGIVYQALDVRLNRSVAIKVLPPLLAASLDAVQRFFREAQIASIVNHPNIVTIHDVGQDQGVVFIVMEYIPGRSLDQVIPRRGLPVLIALEYAVQIAKALAAAHEAGIVHRDLKPLNIRITERGLTKVLDFDLAKPSAALFSAPSIDKTQTGTILGTVGYMSPEQIRAQDVDGRSDVFAFGALFYEMLTGQKAFGRSSSIDIMASILHKDPPAPTKSVPEPVLKILWKCLEKNPRVRFQTMRDLVGELQPLACNREQEPSPNSRKQQDLQQRGLGRLSARTVAALAMFLAVCAFLITTGLSPGRQDRRVARSAKNDRPELNSKDARFHREPLTGLSGDGGCW